MLGCFISTRDNIAHTKSRELTRHHPKVSISTPRGVADSRTLVVYLE